MEKLKIKKVKLGEKEEVKLPFTIYANMDNNEDQVIQGYRLSYEVIKELVKRYNNLEAKYKKLKEKNK